MVSPVSYQMSHPNTADLVVVSQGEVFGHSYLYVITSIPI